ncbi:Uncharacterized protein PRO82_000269 [Candidatus Protochlamydia amoebophila]|uniref:hypothetical protein n=1 Tax=Candidatus Protochlamydia amoebophila TaxID=362787 RepID=UPI001BC9A8E4|nr:hypothetical protein [Candidatus Protochlamydia amoebophila]MBS4162988.1 Uncharacterized protein [Candidatus Protochlamydia amoebophila]
MKYLFLIIAFLIAFIVTIKIIKPSFIFPISQQSYLSDLIVKNFAKRMKQERDLNLEAIGGSVYNGIRKFTLGFRREGIPLNKEESKKLIIEITEEFINEVNRNEMIRPYLIDYPISNINVSMSIFNYDFDGNFIHAPFVSSIAADNNKIVYFFKGNKSLYDYKNEHEKYDEALKKFKEEYKNKRIHL